MVHEQNRALIDGAFFASLTALFSLSIIYIPFFSFLAGLAGPIPTAILVKKYNLKIALLSLTVAVLITVLFYGNLPAALLFITQAGVLGLILGILFKKNISAGIGMVFTSLTAVIMTFVIFLITFLITGLNPLDIAGEVKQAVNEMYEIYRNNEVFANLNEKEIIELQNRIIKTVTVFLPGSLAIWSIVLGSLNYLLTREVFKRLQFKVVEIKPFSRWQLPWYSIWGLILGMGLLLISDGYYISWLSIAAKNILYITAFVFFVMGLSVIVYHFKKFKLTKFIKFIILIIAVIYWPFTFAILFTIGVLDTLVNFRRPVVNK